MIVVSDTSPINYLVLIDEVDILPVLFNRVVAPAAVMTELRHPGTPDPVKIWAASPPDWLEVLSPSVIDSTLALGRGEAEAISLALQLGADTLLMDERKAFVVAKRLGLSATGTLGVLYLAAREGLLDLRQAFAALRQSTFRGPEELFEELLRRDSEWRATRRKSE